MSSIPTSFLITAAHGDVAEAIAGILAEAIPNARVEGADATVTGPGAAVFPRIHGLPLASAPGYPAALRALAEAVGADVVIPCNDREIERLAIDPGVATTLPLLRTSPDAARVFVDKLATADWLASRGFATPWTVSLTAADPTRLPFITKARRGAGSQNVRLVRSKATLDAIKAEFGDTWIAQEYLDDDHAEFTCAVLRTNGEERHVAMRRRLDAGRTVMAVVTAEPAIEAMLQRLAVQEFEGPLNVQLRLSNGEPKIFEINPRFSSTVRMRHRLGFEDLLWAVRARAGERLPPSRAKANRTVYRLSREVVAPAPRPNDGRYHKVRTSGGWVTAAPKPSAEELREFYRTQYYQERPSASYQDSYDEPERRHRRLLSETMLLSIAEARPAPPGKFLDVGCGEGFSLAAACANGWEVAGVDFSDHGVRRFHPELLPTIRVGDAYAILDEMMGASVTYDACVLRNVVKHVLDPADLLRRISGVLAPGAVVAVTVPNDYSPLQLRAMERGKIGHEFWFGPPQHLHYFNIDNGTALARDCGLRVLDRFASFPIDFFLFHAGSNYVADPAQGKGAYRAMIDLDLLMAEQGLPQYLALCRTMAECKVGRAFTMILGLDQ